MRTRVLVILLTITFNKINTQNLNGKWVLKDIYTSIDKKGYPGFQLLNIKDSIADFYTDFSLKKQSSNLRVAENKMVTDKNVKFADYKMISDNHLKLFIDGKSNSKDAVFECDFYKLKPTITTLKKEDIEKVTYVHTDAGRETEYIFNKELWNEENLKLFKRKEGEKKLIEKIDSTFFVSMYYGGKRRSSIPIKEVTSKILKLYAVPNGPMELIAYRKK